MVNLNASPALRIMVVDVPLLEDCKSCCPGFYVAVSHESNQQGSFSGAEIFWSRDGTNWESLGEAVSQACLGNALTALAAPSACISGFDEVNTVDVQVLGSLKPGSMSQDEVLDGGNLALLGGEIIAFRDVTQVDELTYRLSGILRSRLGTEELQSIHTVGDEFVVLNPSLMKFVPIRYGDIDTDRYFKAVSQGGSVSDAISVQRRIRAMNIRPMAPHRLEAVRNLPSSSDVTMRWKRRSRGNFRLLNSTNIQLCCCDGPEFELEIWNTDETTLLRTVELVEVEEYVYTAAQQASDGIAPGAALKIRVFQMSTSVGRGVRGYLSIP